MTDAIIKEQLAVFLFGAMAARAGFDSTFPRRDSGVDIIIEQSKVLTFGNSKWEIPSGQPVHVQVKSTTLKQVPVDKKGIKFDLKTKNYNDLVYRKNEWLAPGKSFAPLILAVLVLKDDPKEWMVIDLEADKYSLNGSFYWYFPEESATFVKKDSTKRIDLPFNQKIGLSFFDNIFNLLPS